MPEPGTYTKDAQTMVEVVANPKTGFEFAFWTGDVADTSAATTTVTMDNDKTVTANFKQTAVVYDLTTHVVPDGAGTTSPSGTTAYNAGSTVQLTATAASGWAFSHWEGDTTATTASTSVTMTGNKHVYAHFTDAVRQATLTTAAYPTAGGSVTGHGTYPTGTTVSIAAMPAEGYMFANWKGNVANAESATTTVVVNADMMVTAMFGKKVTSAVNPNVQIGVTTDSNATGIESVTAVDPATLDTSPPDNANLRAGLIGLTITTDDSTQPTVVKVNFSEAAPTGAVWLVYDEEKKEWSTYPADQAVFSDDRKQVTLTVRDGGMGDADGTANGRIYMLSGFAVSGCGALAKLTATVDNLLVTFDTTGSVGDITFDYGDGTTGTIKIHQYAADGTYTVKVTATDGSCSISATATINVSAAGTLYEDNCFIQSAWGK
jgi:hypothetical protein